MALAPEFGMGQFTPGSRDGSPIPLRHNCGRHRLRRAIVCLGAAWCQRGSGIFKGAEINAGAGKRYCSAARSLGLSDAEARQLSIWQPGLFVGAHTWQSE